ESEVVGHGQVPEDAPTFGDVGHALGHRRAGAGGVEAPSGEGDPPGPGGDQAGDPPQAGGLPGAVGAEQCDDLAVVDLEGEAPRARLSATARSRKMRRPSGTWAMPSATAVPGPAVSRRRPAKVTRPARGVTRPVIPRRLEVFPAPLEPSSATISPSWTSRVRPRTADTGP